MFNLLCCGINRFVLVFFFYYYYSYYVVCSLEILRFEVLKVVKNEETKGEFPKITIK